MLHLDHSYASNLSELGSLVPISPMADADLVIINHALAEQLELDQLFVDKTQFISELFSDSAPLVKHAFAQKYGGHQFGSWNPEIGDGRGLLLTEVVTSKNQRWDLHLKGAGKTPYSRFGDGRAVLRSTIREYLASEALHGLGIPTSRALCLINSSEPVYREQTETGAMLIRACQSHLRFGHFEYFHHTNQPEKLNALFDYTFKYHFAHCLDAPSPYAAMLKEVVHSTADMIARWQASGFNHGVMNTDNMSIHGITFDFGPYAFLDDFEPGYICNYSDHSGRYSFDNQPGIGLWNLNALAHAFTPFLPIEKLKDILSKYEPRLQQTYSQLMAAKFGLNSPQQHDVNLVNEWMSLLVMDKRDYTQSFRKLCDFEIDGDNKTLLDHFIHRDKAQLWCEKYKGRLKADALDHEQRKTTMRRQNPVYILRNYLAQQCIDEAQEGDFSQMKQLLKVLASPFDVQTDAEKYLAPPPDWGKSMEISCSS